MLHLQMSREDHLLLQVPDDIAEMLRQTTEQVTVTYGPIPDDGGVRSMEVTIGSRTLPAKLMRLPTAMETHKSLDGSTFFKTGQMGEVVVADHAASRLPAGTELASGITPPTADIRRRKWRSGPDRDAKEVEQVALEI